MNMPTGQAGWSAAGPAGGDVAYRTQSLKFVPVETGLDESVSLRTLFTLWARAAIISFTVWFVFLVSWLIGTLVLASKLIPGPGSDGPSVPFLLLMIGQILAFVLFWFVLLFSQIQEPIAEWRTLLGDKAPAAASCYATVYGSLTRRRIPVDAAATRVRSDVLSPDVVNNRLTVTDRSYIAHVSVFPYGSSLYVGWSMFRARRGYLLVGHFLKDLLGSLLGRTGLVDQMLRTEKVRAMREALHSAVREGVEVAVHGVEVPIATTFGRDIPVQGPDTAVSAPAAPGGWAPSGRQAMPVPQSAPPGQGQPPGPSIGFPPQAPPPSPASSRISPSGFPESNG